MMTTDYSSAIQPPPRSVRHAPRVLLATDDSEAARAAEEWIRRLRWMQQPTVDILTVAPPPPFSSRLWLQTYRTAVHDALLEARETDLLAAQRIANSVGARLQTDGTVVRVWARHGSISDEIIALSQLEGPDLVLLGRQAKSAQILAWRPNTLQQVARHADAALLVANRPPAAAGPLPRSILLIVPNEPAGKNALHWLDWTGWQRQTDLTLGWRGRHGRESSDALRRLADDAEVATVKEVDLRPPRRGWIGGGVEPADFDLVVLPRTGPATGDEVRFATEMVTAVLILPPDAGAIAGKVERP